jgi:DnaJ-class molecular chaperone
MSREYWEMSLKELLPEHGITVTEQLIEDIYTIREMESEACGYINIPNPLRTEVDTLKKELEKEKDKIPCDYCNGKGRIVSNFGVRSSDSGCIKCGGEGKIPSSKRQKSY